MKNPAYLFVYGTLRASLKLPMSFFLSENAELLGQATVNAKLFDVGSYPALVPSENPADAVIGELYLLRNTKNVLTKLDDYEGCGPNDPEPTQYKRRLTPASLSKGKVIQAWTYVYNQTTEGLPPITVGDYIAYFSQKQHHS